MHQWIKFEKWFQSTAYMFQNATCAQSVSLLQQSEILEKEIKKP